jgi:lysozyme
MGSNTVDLKEQLKRDEGVVNHAYQDSLGFTTIGVGRLIDANRGGGLSDSEVDYLLNPDIADKTAQVLAALPWAKELSEPRLAVLINMAFQMGIRGLLGFPGMLGAVRTGDYGHAALHMVNSKWAKHQTPARAHRLAEQMRLGEWK